MALDKRVDKAREPQICCNCERTVQRGDTYWIVPKASKGPAIIYCGMYYIALPSYFKHTVRIF